MHQSWYHDHDPPCTGSDINGNGLQSASLRKFHLHQSKATFQRRRSKEIDENHPKNQMKPKARAYFRQHFPNNSIIHLCITLKETLSFSTIACKGIEGNRSGLDMASSSSSTLETRLSQIQADLNELKTAVNKVESKQVRMQTLGTSRWESMNLELKELRDDIFEDKLKSIKDLANATGGIDFRLAELEKKVAEMLKENGKAPKPEL